MYFVLQTLGATVEGPLQVHARSKVTRKKGERGLLVKFRMRCLYNHKKSLGFNHAVGRLFFCLFH